MEAHKQKDYRTYVPFHVFLRPDQLEALKKIKEIDGVPSSVSIRMALDKYLNIKKEA